ncbi:hypothetical protein DIT71_03035 [Marinobacter vulgaris]|uniref:DUF5666 domain-containing protein n=1 Tax=Marinobacter vulgaris TaxID=1928331 RepID=A0A2V3ZR41_9GAMM|nr:DUF5666 domain-containing protein [Marinobacter vulgaris]PXX93787.1 hypothetical protein DIT71_03035 [Marinobacter vulgaris]TSJ72194.1 hypothetical protein FPC41_00240 [Marinobacter vulgaris]
MKPKSVPAIAWFSMSALALGILTACGGGGGSGDLDVAEGGIRGTGSSVGPVSGFGSVVVNGVRFNTENLNGGVQSDDGISMESELDEGMILRVNGEWQDDGQGTANLVEYDDTLRGVIETITPDASGAGEFIRLVVLGQTVVVNKQTVVSGTTYTDLLAQKGTGLSIRVSGWRQEDGSFRASYVGVIPATGSDVELEGAIEEDSVQQGSFIIGGIEVTYDANNVEFGEGLGVSDLVPGRFFEVEGSYTGDTLQAREIERDDFRRYGRNAAEDIELTSTIQESFRSSGSGAQTGTFLISDLTVQVTGDTELDGGLTVSDLQQGILVEVEGEFAADGTVVAEEIELREADAEVEGNITSSVDRSARTFEVGGVRVKATPLTIITGDDDARIDFEDLFWGDEVEVAGIEREDGRGDIFLEALKIEREEPEGDGLGEFELEGKLRGIDDQSITVLGVRMAADANAFADNDRSKVESLVNPLTGAFPIIEVEYRSTNVGVYRYRAEEVELEEDDDD